MGFNIDFEKPDYILHIHNGLSNYPKMDVDNIDIILGALDYLKSELLDDNIFIFDIIENSFNNYINDFVYKNDEDFKERIKFHYIDSIKIRFNRNFK
jgi:hypothetical protein